MVTKFQMKKKQKNKKQNSKCICLLRKAKHLQSVDKDKGYTRHSALLQKKKKTPWWAVVSAHQGLYQCVKIIKAQAIM